MESIQSCLFVAINTYDLRQKEDLSLKKQLLSWNFSSVEMCRCLCGCNSPENEIKNLMKWPLFADKRLFERKKVGEWPVELTQKIKQNNSSFEIHCEMLFFTNQLNLNSLEETKEPKTILMLGHCLCKISSMKTFC